MAAPNDEKGFFDAEAPILVVDDARRIRAVNYEFERVFRHAADDVVGTDPAALLADPDDWSRLAPDVDVEMAVRSGDGQAATARVRLIQIKDDAGRVIGRALMMKPVETAPATWRVLCADDNEPNLRVLDGLLAAVDADVTLAHDGLQAIEACERDTFDVILMDVHMPGLDGLEASREIHKRQIERGDPPTPIIAVSADLTAETKGWRVEAGMASFVPKPVFAQELFSAIERVLSGESDPESAAGDAT